MRIITKFFCIILLVSLSGCHNYYDKNYNQNYSLQSYNASCDQLSSRLMELERRKQLVHKNDRFRLRYMFIIPAILEVYKMSKEDSNINKEIELIKDYMIDKHCERPVPSRSMLPTSPSMKTPIRNAPRRQYNNYNTRPPASNPSSTYYSTGGNDYSDYYKQYYGSGQ